MNPTEIEGVLKDPQTQFDIIPHGFMQYVDFMHRGGAVKTPPKDWHECFVAELTGTGGS